MTPSFIGRTAMMPSGVRPSMRFASRPTPLIFLVSRSNATTEGSLSTMPSPFTYTRVLAVPRSTAMALAGKNEPDLKKGQRMYVFTRRASGSGLAVGNCRVLRGKATERDRGQQRRLSGEFRGEWRDQWGVPRASREWGETSGEWRV